MSTIIRIGTSAGGARAKALIAWNPETNEVRTGQVPPPPGFQPWILKFDGVRDQQMGEPEGYGCIEFAYHRMAVASGIEMMECRLYEEGGRAHFMTKRFDRNPDNSKIHMHSLCGLAHYDFNAPGAYGYEQAFAVIQRLNLGYPALTEMFRRMVFNIVARNQDDHTRNIAFLMDDQGAWRLAPAFDVMWAYNASGPWTNRHQMSVGGKRDGFKRADIIKLAMISASSVRLKSSMPSSRACVDGRIAPRTAYPGFQDCRSCLDAPRRPLRVGMGDQTPPP